MKRGGELDGQTRAAYARGMFDNNEMSDEQLAWRKRLTAALGLALVVAFLAQLVLRPAPDFVSEGTICPDGAGPIQYGDAQPYPGDAFPSYVCP